MNLRQILHKNLLLLEEGYDVFNDPRALVLLDYLFKEYPEEEFGLIDIEYRKERGWKHPEYHLYNNPVNSDGFWVLTDEEMYNSNIRTDRFKITKIGDYNIID